MGGELTRVASDKLDQTARPALLSACFPGITDAAKVAGAAGAATAGAAADIVSVAILQELLAVLRK